VVGGAFLPRQLPFEPAVFGVGVDHVGQIPAGPAQIRGVQTLRVLEQGLFAAGPDRLPRRQVLNGGDDDVGLLR
jgi:hypothetical protein